MWGRHCLRKGANGTWSKIKGRTDQPEYTFKYNQNFLSGALDFSIRIHPAWATTPGFAPCCYKGVKTWQWTSFSTGVCLCRVLTSENLCCWHSECRREGWRWGRKYYLVRSRWRCGTQNSFQPRALCYTRMTGLSWQMHLRFEFFQNGFWTMPE